MDDVLHRLREADPARSLTGYTDEKVTADVAAILRADPTGADPLLRRRSLALRLGVAAVSVAAVSAAAIAADVVSWPWSHDGAESTAYAVTKQADGSVEVKVRLDELQDARGLQAHLREAGVPAVVLVESKRGTCSQPPMHGIVVDEAAIRPVTQWDGPRPTDVMVIRPTLLPAGSTVVVGLGFPGETDADLFVNWYVTDHQPPTCLPQSAGL